MELLSMIWPWLVVSAVWSGIVTFIGGMMENSKITATGVVIFILVLFVSLVVGSIAFLQYNNAWPWVPQ